MTVDLFDANFYRAANSDLAKLSDAQASSHFQAYGLNEGREFSAFVDLNFYRSSSSDLSTFSNKQAYEHLQKHGVAEGRSFSPLVDLKFYQQGNTDLKGLSNEQLLQHLQQNGVGEGRQFSAIVDLNFYKAANADLSTFDNKQALQHLEIHGMNEGRKFSLPFDVNYYKSLYADLAAAKLNNEQLVEHFAAHGVNEGRASSRSFDVKTYLATNTDLKAAGYNYDQALDHFALYGYKEGRTGVAPAQQQWEKQISTGVNIFSKVTVDSVGNVYTADESQITKYDNSGNQLWTQRYGTSDVDTPVGIVVDKSGNVYVTGKTTSGLGKSEDTDSWLAKYNSSGKFQWQEDLDNTEYNYASDIAIDASGNVYITGSSSDTLNGERSAWLMRYDGVGNRTQMKQLDTPANDIYTAVTIDNAGNVYVTGSTGESKFVKKYDSKGKDVWQKDFGSNLGFADIAVDSAGYIYISGSEQNYASLIKCNSNGDRIWNQKFDTPDYFETGSNLSLDNAGNVYMLVDSTTTRTYRTKSIVKYDTNSGYRLKTEYTANEAPGYASVNIQGLSVDGAGNLYLAGSKSSASGSRNAWVGKYA